ncbi:cysteine-rich motor neuron 1 protein-like, partial [Saccostrea cucullata]|uniref:cysteine-rich motor neuron 1 protein-like n=1 Tax=Saccostrea cuccullata TaxID=36930 RepID=UPI002ED1BA9E
MRSSPLRGTGDCRLLWDGIVKSVLALCLMCTSYAGVGALKCTPCNPSMCPDPPKNCPRGTILDVCGCCQVCGKNVNETCGGPFEIVGKCGDGLECALTSEVGGSITGSEKGICREIISKKCEKVKCADIAIKRKCPMDSTLVQVEHVNSCCKGSYQCVCNMNFCKKTRCAPGFESVLHHSAEGHPGLCCDQYVCQLS